MKKCVTSKIYRSRNGMPVDFGESLDFLKAVGFEEIDYGFSARELLQDGWKEEFERRLRLCEEKQIRVRYAHLPYDYPKGEDGCAEWQDFLTASCRAMELAKEAGADCAAIHPRSGMTKQYDAEKEYEKALLFLRPYRDYAEKIGFELALENMRGPGESKRNEIFRFGTETDDIIRAADELGVGICWDTGHGSISGQEQLTSIIKIGKRLKMVHLNDNHREDDIHLAPFLGTVDWTQVTDALRTVGYSGAVNLEVNCNGLPESLRRPYAAYMGEAAQTLLEMLTR